MVLYNWYIVNYTGTSSEVKKLIDVLQYVITII